MALRKSVIPTSPLVEEVDEIEEDLPVEVEEAQEEQVAEQPLKVNLTSSSLPFDTTLERTIGDESPITEENLSPPTANIVAAQRQVALRARSDRDPHRNKPGSLQKIQMVQTLRNIRQGTEQDATVKEPIVENSIRLRGSRDG